MTKWGEPTELDKRLPFWRRFDVAITKVLWCFALGFVIGCLWWVLVR